MRIKYVVLLGDGMPDWPIRALGGRTPLEKAKTPNLDFLVSRGRLGLVHTIPSGMPPGSDVGHLSVLGYNPRRYYTGRAPIEAAAMGIGLGPRDVAFRCNLVTLVKKGDVWAMKDFSAGHIPSVRSAPLIRLLQRRLGGDGIEFYPGVSYRHLMVWRNGKSETRLTPPHDITGRPIEPHLPRREGASFLTDLMVRSRDILKGNGTSANSIWLWGQGRATRLPRFPLRGGIISAVDIVRGVGLLGGLEVIRVPGATGFFDTNYENKAAYALRYLRKRDFVFVHVEATDEAGHMGDYGKKIRAIGDFDRRLIGPLLRGLKRFDRYRVLVTSDHATPTRLMTHTPDPSVFVIYDSQMGVPGGERYLPLGFSEHPAWPVRANRRFTEKDAKRRGDVVKVGHHLMQQFLGKRGRRRL